mgnify:CR=1 FL=1
MKQNTTIRSEIEEYIRQSGIDLPSFSKSIGMNHPMLSAMLNSNPLTMSIRQLDLITAGMGLSEGHFFELYIDECFGNTALNWDLLRPFLIRCAELKRLECIRKVIPGLVVDSNQTTEIFDTAEFLLEQDWQKAAAIMYESVIETEELSHSERLAISYYRLFQIYEKDGHKSFMIAMQFIPYRHRLPNSYALDGLLLLIQLFAVKQKWDEVENYSNELTQLAEKVYQNQLWKDDEFNPTRPLVYYYGQGYLFKAGSYEHRGMFSESKKWIDKYADLSWFQGLDETGIMEVERLKLFARANLLSIEIKDGDLSSIAEYLSFLEEYPSEILEGLITLVESANKDNSLVDEYLALFSDKIEKYKNISIDIWSNDYVEDIHYKDPFNTSRYHIFFLKYAVYCFRKSLHREGLENVLHGFRFSFIINNKNGMVNSMSLFEMHRPHATDEQQSVYTEICKEVWENEKNLHPYDNAIYAN